MAKEVEVVIKGRSGIGFLGALTLVLIACKLTGLISWPWLWVLAPLWAPIAIVLSFVFMVLLLVGLTILAGRRV